MNTTDKFTGKAELYADNRPGYPESIFFWLKQQTGFQYGSRAADIGSGTGIFSQYLLDEGFCVTGVEPNQDMREKAEESLGAMESFTSVNGSAEATGLPDHSFDLVTAAQAFHWFSMPEFKTECQRILKENGFVFLVWNSRDKNTELTKETYEICQKFCPEFKGFSGGVNHNIEEFSKFFSNGEVLYHKVSTPLFYDQKRFIDRILSSSYAPVPEADSYAPFVQAFSELFEKYSKNDKILLPNFTHCYLGRV